MLLRMLGRELRPVLHHACDPFVASDVAYRPRNPETTVLYQVVDEQLETFLARQQERDRPVPRFVEEEFRSFLDCGIFSTAAC